MEARSDEVTYSKHSKKKKKKKERKEKDDCQTNILYW